MPSPVMVSMVSAAGVSGSEIKLLPALCPFPATSPPVFVPSELLTGFSDGEFSTSRILNKLSMFL